MRRKIVSSFSFFSSTFELHWGSVWNCVMERQRCQLVENYRRILDRYSNKTFTSAFLLQCSFSSCSSFSKKVLSFEHTRKYFIIYINKK